MTSIDDGDPCIFETCFGDGLLDWSEAEVERIVERWGSPPKRCRSCGKWENSLDTQELRCQICGQREIRSPKKTVGLAKFNKIDRDELDQPLCSTCILADSDAREKRREMKRQANHINGVRNRTYEAHEIGVAALRERGAAKKLSQAEAASTRMGPNSVTAADGPENILETLGKWREPLARQAPMMITRFASIGRDGLTETNTLPTSVKQVEWDTFRARFAGADASGQAFYTALVTNPTIDHALLVRGLGNPNIPSELAAALPRALARVLIRHPKTAGVFQAIAEYRHIEGRGDVRSWASDLATAGKKTGTGAAYEIVALDRLIHGARDALPVYPRDELTLGHKITFNGVYDGDKGVRGRASKRGMAPPVIGEKATADRVSLASAVGNRLTIEADALITRGKKEIAIDFKYVTAGTVPDYGRLADPTKPTSVREQIAGAVLAIEQGLIDEFHFVSNQKFSTGFANQVKWGNDLLLGSGYEQNRIQLHELVKVPS